MRSIPPEVQARMNEHIERLAGYMMEYTEPDKLEEFESIEVEVRNQIQEMVAPKIGEFFFREEGKKEEEKNEK